MEFDTEKKWSHKSADKDCPMCDRGYPVTHSCGGLLHKETIPGGMAGATVYEKCDKCRYDNVDVIGI
jgi:hypothetical protein